MSSGLIAAGVAGAGRVPGPTGSAAAPVTGAGAADGGAAAEHAASKARVARRLPGLCARRDGVIRDRTRQRDTTGGDPLVIGLVRALGFAVCVAAAGVAGGRAYAAGGLLLGLAVGVAVLAAAKAITSGAVRLTRGLLGRQERARRRKVEALNRAVRLLDKRIAQAYSDYGLSGRAPTRPGL
jgi:hypothetical protein